MSETDPTEESLQQELNSLFAQSEKVQAAVVAYLLRDMLPEHLMYVRMGFRVQISESWQLPARKKLDLYPLVQEPLLLSEMLSRRKPLLFHLRLATAGTLVFPRCLTQS